MQNLKAVTPVITSRFESSSFEWCSCMDYGSHRADRCKHIYAVEYAIRFNTLKEVEHLPEEVRGKREITEEKPTIESKSWEENEYSF